MENEYSSLISNLSGQVYQKIQPFREKGEDREVNLVTDIPKNYTPSTYKLSGNILVFILSPELKTLYPNSTARLGDKSVSIQTLESPLEIKVGDIVSVDINWGNRYTETFTIRIEEQPEEPEEDPEFTISFSSSPKKKEMKLIIYRKLKESKKTFKDIKMNGISIVGDLVEEDGYMTYTTNTKDPIISYYTKREGIIEGHCFSGDCGTQSGLSELVFSDNVLEIGSSAFNQCKLDQLVIPSSVRVIGKATFAKCSNIVMNGSVPPQITANTFANNATITVPTKYLETYQLAYKDFPYTITDGQGGKTHTYIITRVYLPGVTEWDGVVTIKRESKTDKIKITTESEGHISYYLYDANNQAILKDGFYGSCYIDFSNYQNGEYRLQLIEPKGSEQNWKIIKTQKQMIET